MSNHADKNDTGKNQARAAPIMLRTNELIFKVFFITTHVLRLTFKKNTDWRLQSTNLGDREKEIYQEELYQRKVFS